MLKIVGFGSGSKENMTLEAVRAIQDSELVVGFRTYVELLKQYFPDKQYYSTNMMQERERCQYAIDRANGAGVQWGQRCIRHGESGL